MKTYFPVLVAKSGEINALKNLSHDVKMQTFPVIQVLDHSYEKIKKFGRENWNHQNNELFLDFSLATYNNHSTKDLIFDLSANNMNIIPVIHSSNNSSYLKLLKELLENKIIERLSLRLKGSDSRNPISEEVLTQISMPRDNISIIIDLEYLDISLFAQLHHLSLVRHLQGLSFSCIF